MISKRFFSNGSLFAILFDNKFNYLEEYFTDNPHKEIVGVEGVRTLR